MLIYLLSVSIVGQKNKVGSLPNILKTVLMICSVLSGITWGH